MYVEHGPRAAEKIDIAFPHPAELGLITGTVAHPERLVIAVGKGEVSATGAFYYLDEIKKIGAMPYRKLLDLTGVATAMPPRIASPTSMGRRWRVVTKNATGDTAAQACLLYTSPSPRDS